MTDNQDQSNTPEQEASSGGASIIHQETDAATQGEASSDDPNMPPPASANSTPKSPWWKRPRLISERWGWADWIVVSLIVGVVIRVYQMRWVNLNPWALRETDSAMLCTFAAALDHPENFQRDTLMNDSANFDFYATLQTPLARLLEPLVGDYGVAFMLPQLPLVFICLLGFYVLGRVLYRDRLVALLLAASCLIIIKIKLLSTYWGISSWTTARDWFQAFLPFVLAGAIYYRKRPYMWPLVMVGMGLLIYCHPVSTPAWALGLWFGLWFCFPSDWTFKKRFGWMFLCGLVFLAVASPFVISYLMSHESGATEQDVEQLRRIVRYRFIAAYTEVESSAEKLIELILRSGLLQMGIIGALVVAYFCKDDRYKLKIIGAWVGTLFVFSVIIPIIEHDWAHRNDRLPFEYDLIRNFRYFFAISLMLAFWPIAVARQNAKQPRTQLYIGAVGVILVGLFMYGYPMISTFEPAVDFAHLTGKTEIAEIDKQMKEAKETLDVHAQRELKKERKKIAKNMRYATISAKRSEALIWVRENTKKNVSFIVNGRHDGLYMRYIGLRSVVYNWKDGGVLIYSNFKRLLKWYKWSKRMRPLNKWGNPAILKKLVQYGRRLKADHVLFYGRVNKAQAKAVKTKILFNNSYFAVLKML